MKKLTTIKACVLASYLLSSVVPAYAAGEVTTPGAVKGLFEFTKDLSSTAKMSATALLAASLYMFFSRKPDNAPDRYDIEKLKAFDFDLENLQYFFVDGLVGHAKESDKVKTNEKGELEVKQGAKERGLGGMVSEMIKPLVKTAAFMLAVKLFLYNEKDGIMPGYAAWKDFAEKGLTIKVAAA